MFRPLLAASAFSILLTAAGAAAAAEGPWVPKAQGSRVGVDFDWWPSRSSGLGTYTSHSLTWDIIGQIQLARVVYLDFDIPLALCDRESPVAGDSTFVFGNPAIGAHWADTIHPKISVFAGGTLSVSTLVSDDYFSAADRLDLYLTRVVASANRAYADVHRFGADQFFIRARGGIEMRILPVLFYRAELVPILAVPISDANDDADFVMEVHNEIEARAPIGVGGGMHLQGVFISDDPSNDNDAAQLAMEPYFVYEPIRGFYARAGLLVALDSELGFGFNRGKVATIRIGLGGKW